MYLLSWINLGEPDDLIVNVAIAAIAVLMGYLCWELLSDRAARRRQRKLDTYDKLQDQ